ncbi:MAG TPA: glycine--tRNA ligase subunit beta, partial [Pelagibacterium sp.]|uniref:glycine--tRNA ligase subunit beta n=1 Tax=Pelagibacterium sp. TaxID=1967288 RepID=UPI002B8434D5
FWAIDEKPTGSKDPFALRRAALGVIRLIADNKLRLKLGQFVSDKDLLSFFHDRLKVSLRDSGARHDLVDAVIAEDSDDILQIVARVGALSSLLDSEDGKALLAGYKRAANILAAEEKKDGKRYAGEVDADQLGAEQGQALAAAVDAARTKVSERLAEDDYAAAIAVLGGLRAPVDAFFEDVLVNDPDPAIRLNRLGLLARLRDTMHRVADFGKVAG